MPQRENCIHRLSNPVGKGLCIKDQTSETIAWLLVDKVVCHHEVPVELLLDRGANLLSSLSDVCMLLGMHKK